MTLQVERGHDVEPRRPELALRLIVLEKMVKSVLALGAAFTFGLMLLTGTAIHLHGMATHLREHVSAAWSVYLADAVVSVTERRHLAVATCALALDGVATGLEWYALKRGHAWGEWLVVAATSSLLPFELVALVRHHHAGRLVVLLVNIAIVVYLVRHARRWSRRPGSHVA
jgi:uncharacterized membrane protein (DUF2068 family)